MSKILTSAETLINYHDGKFYEPISGEAYLQVDPIFGPDDDPALMWQLSGGREPRLKPIWIPTGWVFENTTKMLPKDPADPESPLVKTVVPPWLSLSMPDAVRLAAMIRDALPGGSTVTVYVGPPMDHYEVSPLPLMLSINAFDGTHIRNAGLTLCDLLGGTIYDEATGEIKFTPGQEMQALISGLVQGTPWSGE